CTAAAHMGLITLEDGGEFVVTFLDGQEEYEGTEQNGIETSSWGSYSASFSVSSDVISIDWNTRAYDLEGETGDTFAVICPADGERRSIWGTEIYTSDSSMCTAAAHMGLITLEDGGEFVVTFLDGQEEYEGTEQNGIETSNWGSYSASFSVSSDSVAGVESILTFVSDDESITFDYASSWEVTETPSGILITLVDTLSNGVTSAEIEFIYLVEPLMEQLGIDEDDAAEDAMETVSKAFVEQGTEIGEIEVLELGDNIVATLLISAADEDLLIATVETDEGLILAQASEADNDIDLILSYFYAVLESLVID
ncbi:MAG: LCCL domain-containing protein, partial [Phototrophicaceae bacterium]